jgi:regulator of replication initiation timing
MAEVTQLNLVRESNAHLRRENEELSKRLSTVGVELRALKDSVAPLEESSRKVITEFIYQYMHICTVGVELRTFKDSVAPLEESSRKVITEFIYINTCTYVLLVLN